MAPQIAWVRQDHGGEALEDPAAETAGALARLRLDRQVRPGETVAVAVGSRGIAGLPAVVSATVAHLAGLGLVPFVVAAMGSHGGGDAEGQAAVLARAGITEDAVGCPIRSDMDVVDLGTNELGIPTWFDRTAAGADHVVVVNRVKPHTGFEGPVESGLVKMLLVGLGKRDGAELYHRAVFDASWPEIVDAALPVVMGAVHVLAGVAVVEDARHRPALVEAVVGEDLLAREPALLERARALVPRLPFDDLDIVLIDQIGKDISGTGWDTGTLGRKGIVHEVDPTRAPRVRTIVVRGLTPGTHGNALGVGLAELCRSRVITQMDRRATWLNATTSGDLAAGMVPIHLDTDRELLDACTTRTGLRSLDEARLCWIRNTLDLEVVAVSTALLDEVADDDRCTILAGPSAMPFDADGNLPDLLTTPARGLPADQDR